jgi:hypothetical protein
MRFRFVLLATFIFATLLRAEIKPPQTEFAEYLVAPVRVHLLVTKGELNLTTTLEAKDITRIFGKVNRIWGHAGIHLPVEKLITEPADNPNAYRQNYRSRQLRWLLALRPKASRAKNRFHLYYIKRFAANGVYLAGDGMFVKDTARLHSVKDGIDEPIPRVTAHELGHAFTLRHRQAGTNLLASGTTGWTLNDAEIKQARAAAKKSKWIRPASVILKEADALFAKDKKKEAAKLYRLLADIPLLCQETARAKKRSR